MPKLKPDTQRARREHILDAAELCFARAGFHRCTMQDICKEASVSPGALYLYFPSKEALIAGLAERDRAEFAARFATISDAPDFLQALSTLAEHYFVDQPAHKRLMCIEIGMESTRNPQVGEIHRSVDAFITGSFEDLFRRLAAAGRIAPKLDVPTLARTIAVLGDGMFWRSAVDPNFDAKALLPAVIAIIGTLLNPVSADGTYAASNTSPAEAAE